MSAADHTLQIVAGSRPFAGAPARFITLIVVGGIAVLGSYVWGVGAPGVGAALWGGVPESLRPLYTTGASRRGQPFRPLGGSDQDGMWSALRKWWISPQGGFLIEYLSDHTQPTGDAASLTLGRGKDCRGQAGQLTRGWRGECHRYQSTTE